jgi:hypothetical protein
LATSGHCALHDADPDSACLDALTRAPVRHEHGFVDVRAQVRARWLEVADEALTAHRRPLGMVSIDMLLDACPEGALAMSPTRA